MTGKYGSWPFSLSHLQPSQLRNRHWNLQKTATSNSMDENCGEVHVKVQVWEAKRKRKRLWHGAVVGTPKACTSFWVLDALGLWACAKHILTHWSDWTDWTCGDKTCVLSSWSDRRCILQSLSRMQAIVFARHWLHDLVSSGWKFVARNCYQKIII